jgi:hypothetical protein
MENCIYLLCHNNHIFPCKIIEPKESNLKISYDYYTNLLL